MSPIAIASSLFSLFKTASAGSANATGAAPSQDSAAAAGKSDFSSALALRLATLRAQSVDSLSAPAGSGSAAANRLDFLNAALSGAASSSGPSALQPPGSGRNLSLFDPESAYRMMSLINLGDATYKAQSAELSAMKGAVATLQSAGATLADATSASASNDAIKAALQSFTDEYNGWIKRFDGTVRAGGVLAGTQAAVVSLNELEWSVENIFNGAKDGFRGLADLGLSIDPASKLASFDAATFDKALAANRLGAVNTIDEFAANFAKSAGLLNSPNNFIPNRLANLDRVISYIDAHRADLQREFGLGAPASSALSEPVAKALAAYRKVATS